MRARVQSGSGVPSQVPPARIWLRSWRWLRRWRLSVWVLAVGYVAGVAAIAVGGTLAVELILLASLGGGLLLGWIEDRQAAAGRRCRVCCARDTRDAMLMWAAPDLCLPCETALAQMAVVISADTERRCRVCGCTDERACIEMDMLGDCVPCHWVEPDLCSTCAPEDGRSWGEGW